jgi:Skp family chaperone for outer membrane proteins
MGDMQKEIQQLKHQLEQNAISSEGAANRQAKSVEIMARTLLLMLEHLTKTEAPGEGKKIGYILGNKMPG